MITSNNSDEAISKFNNLLIGALPNATASKPPLAQPNYLTNQEQLEKLLELFTDKLNNANGKLADAATVLSHLFDDVKGLINDEQREMLNAEMSSLFAAQNEIRTIVAVIDELVFGNSK